MLVDTEIQRMLEATRAAGLKPIDEATVDEVRSGYRVRYIERSLPAPANPDVETLNVPSPGGYVRTKLHRPPAATGALPVIVYFHGGGFVLGDAEAYDSQSSALAERTGCQVLFAEYRLAPEHPFPAAVEDAVAVVDWVAEHAEEFGADAERLVVAGDSAGGNLAINVSLIARERNRPAIGLQVLAYPVTDFRPYAGGPSYPSVESFSRGYGLDRELMIWFREMYLPDPSVVNDVRVSPILAPDLGGLPPTLLFTAGNDPLKDMGIAFAEQLRRDGTPVVHRCFETMVHNFLGHAGVSRGARCAFDEVCTAIRDRLNVKHTAVADSSLGED